MSLYSLPKHPTSVLFSSLNKLKFLWIWEIFSHCPYRSFYSKKHILTCSFHLFTNKGMEPTAFQYSTPAGRKLKAWKATETHMPDKLHSPCRTPFLLKKPLCTLSIHCTPLGYAIFCLAGRKPYCSLHSLHSYTVSPHMSNRFLVSIFRRAKVGNHFFFIIYFLSCLVNLSDQCPQFNETCKHPPNFKCVCINVMQVHLIWSPGFYQELVSMSVNTGFSSPPNIQN